MDEINKKLLEALEIILFTGYGHYKRGQGITRIPWKRFGISGKNIYHIFQHLFNNDLNKETTHRSCKQ